MYCMYAKDATLPCSTVDSPFGSGKHISAIQRQRRYLALEKAITEDNRAWCLANRKQTRLSNGSCLIATFISTHPRARLFTVVKKRKRCNYIVKGSVAVLIKDEEGKEMILSYLNQGDFIGELGLFEEGRNVAHGYVRNRL